MDQYLLIPFLGGWTSIYQLFWCSPGVQGFDTLPYIYIGSPCLLIHPPFLCQMIPQVAMSRFSPCPRPRLGLPVSPLCDRTDFRLGKSQASRSHRPKMGTKNGDHLWLGMVHIPPIEMVIYCCFIPIYCFIMFYTTYWWFGKWLLVVWSHEICSVP